LAQQAGLPRALFCVRLLEQKGNCTAEERLAFLMGAYLAADLEGLLRAGILASDYPVLLTGGGGIGAVWERVLRERKISSRVITAAETEAAVLAGLREVLINIRS
jgi:2-keto-3-deoxy-galactonokinase